ncbi:AAA family ATPase [Methylophilus sp. 'Pure River']|uniref:AAA family ATPase n=1 Tax=Methylophilus sp. 'Pure River' TaxID=3377117 RepID=UPI00398E7F53
MKILIISENNQVIQSLSGFQTLYQRGFECVAYQTNLVSANQKIAAERPDVLMIDVSRSDVAEFDLIERYKTQYSQMTFMLLSEEVTSEMLLKGIRAGFSEVLALPLSEQSLIAALERYMARSRATRGVSTKVISVISCKGGAGATFVATNLAYVMAEYTQKRILLIDANPYFGDACMYLSDEKAGASLAELCQQIHRLDYAFLDSSLIEITPRLKVLAASDNPAHASDVKPEHLEKIIEVAGNYYDLIILDLGRHIDALTVKAMDLSHQILPVVQLVLPYIRDANYLYRIFSSLGYAKEKIYFLVNRYDKNDKLKISDFEQALGLKVSDTLPNEYALVNHAINQGEAVYKLNPKSDMAKKLKQLAEKFTGEKVASAGFFSNLFK